MERGCNYRHLNSIHAGKNYLQRLGSRQRGATAFLPTFSTSGKAVVAATTATWVQLTLGITIYNVWVSSIEVKPPFSPKK